MITLLQLVDRASGIMGLSQPSIVIGSATNQTMQLLALVNALGGDLVREYEWQRLVKAYVFQTTAAQSLTSATTAASAAVTHDTAPTALAVGNVVSGAGIRAGTEILTVDSSTTITLNMPATATAGAVTLTFAKQDYALPSDFDRMISDTNWDRTNNWGNLGPASSQQWQGLQGGLINTWPQERFRLYHNKLRIIPAVTTVANLAYEYVSTYWVLAAAGTAATKSAFTIDTDTCVFPDDLMMAGLKYYFLKAKKLDFGIELAEFQNILSTRKAQDQPVGALSLSPRHADPYAVNIAEGNWWQ